MNRIDVIRRRCGLLSAAVVLTLIFSSALGQPDGFVLHAGTLMVSAEKPLLKNQSVVVRGRQIVEIRNGFVTADDELPVLDFRTAFVMPGLIDTHVHLTSGNHAGADLSPLQATDADLVIVAASNAEKILRAGFTTVMELGNGTRQHELAIYALRDAIAAGELPGPEILAAGSPIAAVGFDRRGRLRDEIEQVAGSEGTCAGPEQCRQRTLEQLHRGADFINVYHTGSMLSDPSPSQTLSDAELKAIADTAALAGRVVIADGGNDRHSARGTNRAIELGFPIIDTVTYPDEQTFELLKQRDGYFAPHVYALEAAIGNSPETLHEGTMGGLPRPVLELLFAHKQATPSALIGYRAGAQLLLASDSGVFPHGDNANELLAYTRLGIDPADTLRAATLNAARAFRIDERTGAIEPGKEADLVVFAASPLADMSTVLKPLLVVSDGRLTHLAGH